MFKKWLGLFFIVTGVSAKALSEYPLHLPPGASSREYQAQLRRQTPQSLDENIAVDEVQKSLEVGTRNLRWLDFLNQSRPSQDKIVLTKPGDLKNYPLEKPNRYSPALIKADHLNFQAQIPDEMRKILFEGAPFSSSLSIPLTEYLSWAKKIDDLYQTAARWKLMEPSLFWYSLNQVNDIRGFYHLEREPDLRDKLVGWRSLDATMHAKISPWLVNICQNAHESVARCTRQLDLAQKADAVILFYQKYVEGARKIYNHYFSIGHVRTELRWDQSNARLAVLPFRQTEPLIQNFLAANIEDEWKWLGWQLRLEFVNSMAVHVDFQSGVVPHVSGLAGDTIVMDKNASLNEWDVQWTIRHEFGHVLGFPDCYVEFYDSAAKEMVNYQIDVTNLMCSRTGRMQQGHYDELKKTYFK